MVKANGHGPKRAILYARVSTEEQAKTGYSIPEQLRELRAYAARESYRVVEEVVDDGHSGADPHRPGLRRVMGLAEAGAMEVVLTKKRNRLFRSRLYRLLWDQDLGELGVKLIALDDTGNRFGDAMQDEFAEWEREEIAKRTQAGSWRSAGAASSLKGSGPPTATARAKTATPSRCPSRRWRWCGGSSAPWPRAPPSGPCASHSNARA